MFTHVSALWTIWPRVGHQNVIVEKNIILTYSNMQTIGKGQTIHKTKGDIMFVKRERYYFDLFNFSIK